MSHDHSLVPASPIYPIPPIPAPAPAPTRLFNPHYWGVSLLTLAIVILLAPHPTSLTVAATATGFAATSSSSSSSLAIPTSPTSGCGHGWTVYYCPSPGPAANGLLSVAAISPDNVWAVGGYYDASVHLQALIEHWDGSVWSISASPVISDSNLNAVVAVSAQDIWAFGYVGRLSSRITLTEHWDGSAWSVVPSPNVPNYPNELRAGAAVAPDDIWAFGGWELGTDWQTLAEHWDGTQWSIVPSPNRDIESNLNAAAALATNDVWVLGEYWCSCGPNNTFTVHWDGSQWSIVPSPRSGFFYGATALTSDDVWGVGDDLEHPSYVGTLTEHWDGSSWQQVPSPSVPNSANRLNGVKALAPDDVWAVGDNEPGSEDIEPMVMHWDGTQWSQPERPPVDGQATLVGVSGLSSTDVWAVGLTYNSPEQAIALHWDGPPCGGTPSPTPTRTPATPTPTSATPSTRTSTPSPIPTHTPTPTITPSTATPLATATATATACSIQFTDVPHNSPFYSYVRCMACRGLVNGYATGCESGNPCFRPNNNVTRGQLAKIISNGAGWLDTIPSTQQTFDDVPSSNAFWLYVERASIHGAIAGYAGDGVTTNPCTGSIEQSGHLYFRYCNNATRGQIAKIDSVAAGYSDSIPSTQQTFDDVPHSNPFWLYTERVYMHRVINGYTGDGMTVNPCTGSVEQAGHHYFRWCNNATRGQTSKIVANTFFPNCQTP